MLKISITISEKIYLSLNIFYIKVVNTIKELISITIKKDKIILRNYEY